MTNQPRQIRAFRLEFGGLRLLQSHRAGLWGTDQLWPWDRVRLRGSAAILVDEHGRELRAGRLMPGIELGSAHIEVARRLKRRQALRAERLIGSARVEFRDRRTDRRDVLLIAAAFGACALVLACLRGTVAEAPVLACVCLAGAALLGLLGALTRPHIRAVSFSQGKMILHRFDGGADTLDSRAIRSVGPSLLGWNLRLADGRRIRLEQAGLLQEHLSRLVEHDKVANLRHLPSWKTVLLWLVIFPQLIAITSMVGQHQGWLAFDNGMAAAYLAIALVPPGLALFLMVILALTCPRATRRYVLQWRSRRIARA